jgi:hypothetical protein
VFLISVLVAVGGLKKMIGFEEFSCGVQCSGVLSIIQANSASFSWFGIEQGKASIVEISSAGST